MIEIIPSLLATTQPELEKIMAKIASLSRSGRVHVDVADGVAVPNTTLGREEYEPVLAGYRVDVHLMVSQPKDIVPLWLDMAGLETIIFHIEASDKSHEIVDTIHRAGKKAGIAINPHTPLSQLHEIVDSADLIHFMTVDPGFYKSQFQPNVVEKVKQFHTEHSAMPISVDGGITPETISQIVSAGATQLVVGSYIIESPNPKEAVINLQNHA